MPYREFDGPLDSDDKKPATGFVPFDGELDAPAAKPKRTWAQAAADTGVQLGEGVNNILGAIPSLIAPESKAAGFFKENADFWRDKQSAPLKERIAGADKAITAAGADGMVAQISEAASQYFSDPALAARFVTTNLPSMIPGVAAAKVAQAAALARGATAARAAAAATTAAGGANAVLNAGGARGEAFEDIKGTLIKQGMSAKDAEEQAIKDSRLVAAIGGAAGFISGKTGLESAIAGRAASGAAVRRGAGAFASEMAGEQLEEVAPKLATNYQAGQYDKRALMQDVGRTMVETAIGAGPGAVVGGVSAARAPHAPAAPLESPPPAPQEARREPTLADTAAPAQPAAPAPSIADIGAATSVDEAIAAAQAVVSAPVRSAYATPADIDALEAAAGIPAGQALGQAPGVWRMASDIPTLTDVIAPADGIPVLSDAVGPQVWRRPPDIPTLTDTIGKPQDIPTLTDIIEPGAHNALLPQNAALAADGRDQAAAGTGAGIAGPTDAAGALPGAQPSTAAADVQSGRPDLVRAGAGPDADPALTATPVRDAIDKIVDPAADWHAFPAETGTLNIPRADMPQIRAEHRGAMTQFLKARGIAHQEVEVPAESLKPTQAEFSLEKVNQALNYDGGERSILVSSDGHVLDGHHQWLAAVDAERPVKAIVLDAPIRDLIDTVREFPSAGLDTASAPGAPAAPAPSKLEQARAKHQKQDEAVRLAAQKIEARKAQKEKATPAPAAAEPEQAGAPDPEPVQQATPADPTLEPTKREAERAKLEGKRKKKAAPAPEAVEPKQESQPEPAVEQAAPVDPTLDTPAAPDVDTGADIPRAFFKKVKVDHDLWIEDEGVMETVKERADVALKSVREDIANLKALIKCMKG
jgi:hypothetical protein